MGKLLALLMAFLMGWIPLQAVRDTLTYTRMEEVLAAVNPQETFLRGVWLSQFDMQPLYRDGNKQRDEQDFYRKAVTLCQKLEADGFNTVFLQLRPNGDSMYESAYFPLSKYVAGTYGGEISYDPIRLFVLAAKEHGLSVHGWLNPLRLMTVSEMGQVPREYPIKEWYLAKSGQVKLWDGRLYLDPSYPEVQKLIADGASEMLTKYDLAGIHMDDYFYPTTEEAFDREEFVKSGYEELGAFRRKNINDLVQKLYQTAHTAKKIYGISPAGNLDSLYDGYYADAETWCTKEGYIDYILPQLYFGFENKYCPFDEILDKWASLVQKSSVQLYVGLAASKAVLGCQGELDTFAGTPEGRSEWIRCKDILARSLQAIYASNATGYCFFSASYLYDLQTGTLRKEIQEEYASFGPLLQVKR